MTIINHSRTHSNVLQRTAENVQSNLARTIKVVKSKYWKYRMKRLANKSVLASQYGEKFISNLLRNSFGL